jgi:anti-sigma factor RsiW
MSGANCKPFVMLISARIDGALDAARFGQLAEHLAECTSCRARELSLLAQGQALRAGSAARLAALESSGKIDLTGFADRVLRAATQSEKPAHPTRWERLALSLQERWEHQRLALSASLGVSRRSFSCSCCRGRSRPMCAPRRFSQSWPPTRRRPRSTPSS